MKPDEISLDEMRALRRRGEHAAARDALLALAAERPDDAMVQFETAWVHDFLGEERAAVPYYEAALRLGLPDEAARMAYVGLGSSLRTLGDYASSRSVLEAGLARFPEAAELRAFLAMTRYNLGDARDAVAMVLALACDVSADPALNDYAAAIRFYAEDLDRRWD